MKSRQVSFYVDMDDLPRVMETICDDVLPQYSMLPHFLGVTVVKADLGERSEVIATSFWDDGLEGSEEVSAKFIAEIVNVTGRNPARKTFDVLYAEVRDSNGTLCSN